MTWHPAARTEVAARSAIVLLGLLVQVCVRQAGEMLW
jgi:hypothetical protein